jgi:hypothetical protein
VKSDWDACGSLSDAADITASASGVLQWFTNGELKPQPASREANVDRTEQDGQSI